MPNALVLMKAMPPTVGHGRLIEFASNFMDLFSDGRAVVLIDHKSDEPMVSERVAALEKHAETLPGVYVVSKAVEPQDETETDDFWGMWKSIIKSIGVRFDYVIGSEPYCASVAELIGARYIPYDPKRELIYTKATDVRDDPEWLWDDILPEFKPYLQTTVTIFGAESNGKTTLSKEISKRLELELLEPEWIFEWARPYLETVGPEITKEAMEDIWFGQWSVEESAKSAGAKIVIRDTDLFSTVGYWEQPHWQDELGPVPHPLIADARRHQADLYIILRSNIPFEQDIIRYGGDKRESPDEYWIALAEKYNLPHIVIEESALDSRLATVLPLVRQAMQDKYARIRYERTVQDGTR